MKKLDLKPFDAAAKCPKCHGDDIGTTYQKNAHCKYYPERCEVEAQVHDPACCDTKNSEHLHRFCRRCHYYWAEGVLASQPKDGE